jgi:hypothetical protein
MHDRESQIRELARSMWELEGSPEGRHDDHWLEAEKQINGNNMPLKSDVPRPPEMDLEPIPLPDQVDTDDYVPPVRSGQSANKKNPVESTGPDN